MKNYVKWEFEFKGKRIEFRFSSPRITLYKHNSDIYGRFENIFGNIYNWKENKDLYDMRMKIIVANESSVNTKKIQKIQIPIQR